MNTNMFDKCRTFLQANDVVRAPQTRRHNLAVTISRETGAGAITVGRLVAERMQARSGGIAHPWAVFDKNLVETALEDHGHRKTIAQYLPEDVVSVVENFIEEALGAHPDADMLMRHVNQTILSLASMGNVVLIGRGANMVTENLPHVLHVRLIAPLDFRIRHIQDYFQMTQTGAEELIYALDRARARYVRRHFHCDVRDPAHYHLTINTGRVGFEETAGLIEEAMVRTIAPIGIHLANSKDHSLDLAHSR